LSSDRLPSIPFNLLPVGTSSSTVARGNHTHEIAHITNLASSLDELHSRIADLGVTSLKLIRSRGATDNLTDVGTGITAGSVTLTESVNIGDTLLIEVNDNWYYDTTPKVILATIGRSSGSSSTDNMISFSAWNGTNFSNKTFTVWASGTTLYFGSKRRFTITLLSDGSSLTGANSDYTLYVGRVWKVLI